MPNNPIADRVNAASHARTSFTRQLADELDQQLDADCATIANSSRRELELLTRAEYAALIAITSSAAARIRQYAKTEGV